jgi:hypothetical protein
MGIVRNFLNRIHWPPRYAGCVEFRAPCGVGIRASRMLASRYLLAAERTLP